MGSCIRFVSLGQKSKLRGRVMFMAESKKIHSMKHARSLKHSVSSVAFTNFLYGFPSRGPPNFIMIRFTR